MNIYIINLPKDTERQEFQKKQFHKLDLKYELIAATTVADIEDIYHNHYLDWQRPLRKVEVACYFSHQKLWKRVLNENQPALILEDDAILCHNIAKILDFSKTLQNIDCINFETVGRKKLLGKEGITVADSGYNLLPLYLDRAGAGGYILYPSGAKKLLDYELQYGIGLSDAQRNSCSSLVSYQIEPACVVQMDQCHRFNLQSPLKVASNIATLNRPYIAPKHFFYFKFKRLKSQIEQGYRQVRYCRIAKRRQVDIKIEDF